MKAFSILALVSLGVAVPALAETLTNRSIMALSSAGVDADTIIAKIQASDTKFDLSTDQIIALRKAGVTPPVISAMFSADGKRSGRGVAAERAAPAPSGYGIRAEPSGARPAGIYLTIGSQLVRLDPNVSGQTKTGGFLGSALTYGIAKVSTKVVLQGENARVHTGEHSPLFYFYLPAATTHASSGSFDEQSSGAPDSPNQFSLIRLEKRDGGREARIGRANVSGYQAGVVSKDRVDFTYDEARPGVFSVKPSSPLTSGEYAFVIIGSGGASVAKFFDFSVE